MNNVGHLNVDHVDAYISGESEGDTIFVRAHLEDGAVLVWEIPLELFLRAAHKFERAPLLDHREAGAPGN